MKKIFTKIASSLVLLILHYASIGQCYSDLVCSNCNVIGSDTISCISTQDFDLFVDAVEFSTSTVDVIYNVDGGASMRFADLAINSDMISFNTSEASDFTLCIDSVLVSTTAMLGDTCVLSGVCLSVKVASPEITDPGGPYGPLCENDLPITLTGTPDGSGGSWSGSGVTDAGDGTASFDPIGLAGSSPITVTYDYTDPATGCVSNSVTTMITVLAVPTATATGSETSACGLSDGVISLSTNINNATLTVSGITGVSSTTTDASGNASIPGLEIGTYTFTLSNGSCESAQISAMISEPDGPSVTVTGPLDVCNNEDPVTLIGLPSGGTFSGSTGVDATTGEFNPVGLTPNSYTITYEFTDPLTGCSGSSSTEIEVLAAPATFATNNGPACSGEDVNLSSGGGSSYAWSGPNSFTSSLEDPVITGVTSADAGTYQVIAMNADGCTDTATTMVVVNPTPTAVADNSGAACEGANIMLTASGAGSGGSYEWDGPDNYSSTSQNPVLTSVSSSQSGMYTVVVQDVNGCTSSATTTVTVNAPPMATASNTGGYCPGTTIELMASGGTSYSWEGPGNFSSSSQNPTIPNASPTNDGSYSVTVTATNTCTATQSTMVEVYPAASTTASNLGPFCVGETISLSTTASSGATYNWSGPGSFTSTSRTPSNGDATSAKAGLYRVTITDMNQCTASSNTTVVVNPLPIATATITDEICQGQTLSLSSSGGSIYMWSGPAGFTSSMANPTIPNAGTNRSGTYTVTVTDSNDCISMASTSTVVNPLPVAIAQNGGPYCAGQTINLSSTGGQQYLWSGPDGFSSMAQNPTVATSTTANSGMYTVQVTDVNGCSNDAMSTVTVHPLPSAGIAVTDMSGIADDNTICLGESVDLTATPSGITYRWSSAANSSSSAMVSVSPLQSTSYRVTVTDANGCTDDRSTRVDVNQNPEASILYESRFSSLIYGSDFDLTNTSTVSPDANQNQVTWCFEPSNAVDLRGQSVNSQVLDSIIAVNANSTNAQEIEITLKVEDDNLCQDEEREFLSVTSLGCSASSSHDNNQVYCQGDDVTITYDITLDQGEAVTSAIGQLLDGNQVLNTYNATPNASVTFDISNVPAGDLRFEFRFTTNLDDCSDAPSVNRIQVERRPTADFVDPSLEAFCLSMPSLSVALNTNFDQLLFANEVTMDYNLVQNGETVELSSRFGSSQSELTIPVNNGIGLLDTGIFTIEILSITIEDCPTQMINTSKTIRLYDELSIRRIEDDCNTDGTFDLLFAISGGSGDYMFGNLPAGVLPELVNVDSSYFLVTLPSSYSFDITDATSNCADFQFDNNTVTPANCDCGEVQAATNAGNLDTDIVAVLDGTYRVCNESSFKIFASNVNLQRDSTTQVNSDELLLLVVPPNTTPQDIDADRTIIRGTQLMERVGSTYETTITGLQVGSYSVYTAVVERNTPLADACIKTSAEFLSLIAYQTPAPMISLADDTYCVNASNVLAEGMALVQSTENGYEGSSYQWTITDTGGDTVGNVTTINDLGSEVALQLSETTPNQMYAVNLTELVDYRGTSCMTTTSTTVFTNESVAPDTASIIYWPGNILACTADTTTVTFNWGYVVLTTGEEVNLGNTDGQFLLADDDIISMIGERTYFVDLRDRDNPDNRCSTRIYFTATEALERQYGQNQTSITAYPNPTDGRLNIDLVGKERGKYKLQLYNYHGQPIWQSSVDKDGYARSYTYWVDQAPGLYILQVIGPDMVPQNQKLIIR